MWLPLALRNLLRNRRRTLLTLAVIALGTLMGFQLNGYINRALETVKQGAVDQYGNLQIASPLLWNDDNQGDAAMLSPEVQSQLEGILKQNPEVAAASPQMILSGMASTAEKAKVLNVLAFEPGNAALDYDDLVVEGAGLSEDVHNPVLIGRSLAKELDLAPGDTLRMTTSTIGGAYNQETLQVVGIYSRNDAQDESQLVFVPLSTGQKLLKTDGVNRFAVTLNDLESTDATAAALQDALSAAGMDLSVRTWEQLSTYYQQTRGFFELLFGFLMGAISLLVFFIVFQVLSMSFLERTREVGTIRAIGTKRRQVFYMFILESVSIGLLGGALGLGLGWLAGNAFNALNLGWTPPGALRPLPVQVDLTWQAAWLPFVVSALATLLSALYPTVHSSRLRIVNALRAN